MRIFLILIALTTVALSQGLIIDSYKFVVSAPGNFEDFEETGSPSSGLWVTGGGDTNYDYTGHSTLISQALGASDHNETLTGLSTGSVSKFHVAFMFEWIGGETLSGALSEAAGFRNSGADVCLMVFNQQNNPTNPLLALNGSNGTASSTFTMTKNVRYYVWIDFNASGTSSLHISTTTTKPSVSTDTSTAFATSGTSGSTQPNTFAVIGTRNNGQVAVDEVYWDANNPIGNNPWGL